MRLLILGGAGFMGSNFVRHSLRAFDDAEVTVYDKLTYAGRLENLHDVLDKIGFVRGDVLNEELLEHVVDEFGPDIIVNFAAETHVDRSINEPAPFIRTNIMGVFTVLEVIRKKDVPLYVHISTDEVYGDLSWTNEAASEDWPLRPSSPYSVSKASADLLIFSYRRTYGIRYKIIRPSNNYGPYQHPEKLIPRTIVRLLKGKPATIYGDGEQVRDWLYVIDFCRGVEAVIKRGADNTVYNLCAQEHRTVKEIVEMIARIMGKDPERDIVHVPARPGEDRRYAMRCERVREIGWEPSVKLEEGLRMTIEWYLSNKWWWEPVLNPVYVLSDTPWNSG